MKEFKRENKYLVLKWEDIGKFLGEVDKKLLEDMCNCITASRHYYIKKDNAYIVVNEDEPYAEKVWDLIKEQWEKDEQGRAVDRLVEKSKHSPKGSFLNP